MEWLILLFTFLLTGFWESAFAASDLNGQDPKFSDPIKNITIPVGREAVLTCKVHDLVSYKVAWLRVDTQTILTIHNHVITKNHRIGVSHTEERVWQLRIRDVREADRGWYMCQINTDPMKSQVGYLDVVVPPDIMDHQTSRDQVVEEAQNVTLTCSASGLPEPTIIWRREKDNPILYSENKEIFSIEGRNLFLRNVNRHYMGAYLCIASNGVPPTVSKRILLIVNFQPTIWTKQEKIYAYRDQQLTLECISESYPVSVNYWLRDRASIHGGTYESLTIENVFRIVMRLQIRTSKPEHFGEYKCIARNSLGESHRTITIFEKARPNHLLHQAQSTGLSPSFSKEIESLQPPSNNVSSSIGINLEIQFLLLSILPFYFLKII